MRICFLEGDMSRKGGTERMTSLLANALSQHHQVWVISLRMEEPQVFFPLKPQVSHVVLTPARGKSGIIKQIGEIRGFFKKHHIQRVINVDMGMGFYGILAARGTETRVITWEHGNFFNNWGSRLFPHMRRFAARHSHALVVLTRRDRENYSRNIARCAPVHVIPNPARKHEFCYDTASRTILSVGHLNENKGYHRVVEIARRVLPQRPEWHWVIYGEGPERERLEQEIRLAGLEGRVLLPGVSADMDGVYRQAACLVLTSDLEGLPMVLLEGKSWGLPLLAFDIMTGPGDIIADGENGCLVPPHDIDRMSDRLAGLMDDEALRRRFSAHSQNGMERFDWEKILGAWETLLKEV